MTTTPPPGGPTVAGQVPLSAVLDELAQRRPVFHSEADLQHSFAQLLWELAPEVRSRLEVPRRHNGRVERLDLLCLGSPGRTAIEFKYPTRRWTGTAGTPPEDYALRNHAAMDLARLHFVRDMVRLERFCSQPDENGLAVLLTNDPSLWTPPAAARKRTRDEDFRIHQGRVLTGTLLWAEGAYKPHTCTLRGTYTLDWRPYAQVEGVSGEFRCLAVSVSPAPAKLGDQAAEEAEGTREATALPPPSDKSHVLGSPGSWPDFPEGLDPQSVSFREARCTWHGTACTETPVKVVRSRDGRRWAACAQAVRSLTTGRES
ncbi:hypothetical protein [Streptomyces sp. Tu 3180]|uniref:hypothetical protein n=1 Tax=Streptomyces sp. Tu 3180 TaxID=2682611 RepID=UPI001AA06149|nr:hypothetical protein [Streptomyces sp. Tu 3180]